MKAVYLFVYCETRTHPHQWTITELRLKERILNIFFFEKLINGITLAKAFILLLAFLMTPSK